MDRSNGVPCSLRRTGPSRVYSSVVLGPTASPAPADLLGLQTLSPRPLTESEPAFSQDPRVMRAVHHRLRSGDLTRSQLRTDQPNLTTPPSQHNGFSQHSAPHSRESWSHPAPWHCPENTSSMLDPAQSPFRTSAQSMPPPGRKPRARGPHNSFQQVSPCLPLLGAPPPQLLHQTLSPNAFPFARYTFPAASGENGCTVSLSS